MSPKNSTRSTAPATPAPQESQPEATRTPRVRIASPAAKAKPASAGAPLPASKPKAAAKPTPKVADKATARPPVARGPRPKALTPEVKVPTPAPGVVRVVTDEDIRVRAYFLSLEHRERGGSDVDFWLVAERELRDSVKSKG